MKKKIICLFACMLLMSSIVPTVGSLRNNAITPVISSPSISNMIVKWTEIQKILPLDGTVSDSFGYSVSVSGDTALIGVPAQDSVGSPGYVYVFTRTDTRWTQQAKLFALDGEESGLLLGWDVVGVPELGEA